MSVVDKTRDIFLARIENKYNQEEYFIDTCFKGETKYSGRIATIDTSLELFFRENNYIIVDGRKCVYCNPDILRKVRSAYLPEEHIYHEETL